MIKYFVTEGRMTRTQWWVVTFCTWGTFIPALFISTFLEVLLGGDPDAETLHPLTDLTLYSWYAANFWVNLCATVQRFHDRDKSGLWFLVYFNTSSGIHLGFCGVRNALRLAGPQQVR